MLRLQNRLKTLIVIILVSSCQSVKKPQNIWDCRIIIETFSALCINNTSHEEKEISINDMNKYVAFSNDDWGRVLTYIKQLEEVTPRKYHNKFLEFVKTNKKHIEKRQNNLY